MIAENRRKLPRLSILLDLGSRRLWSVGDIPDSDNCLRRLHPRSFASNREAEHAHRSGPIVDCLSHVRIIRYAKEGKSPYLASVSRNFHVSKNPNSQRVGKNSAVYAI